MLLYTVCNSCNRRFNVSVAQLLTRTRDFEAHQRKKVGFQNIYNIWPLSNVLFLFVNIMTTFCQPYYNQIHSQTQKVRI